MDAITGNGRVVTVSPFCEASSCILEGFLGIALKLSESSPERESSCVNASTRTECVGLLSDVYDVKREFIAPVVQRLFFLEI